jgi:preprotein translocase subunit YajC
MMSPPGGAEGQGGGNPLGMLYLIVIMSLLFYFALIRPQRRMEKERKKMIDEVKSGDRVMFSGGILGVVTNAKETTFVVKIADNVKIEVAKSAVSKVLDKGEKAGTDTSK